ncbi:unnamed protein product [Arctogadus glacialis]
MSFIQKEVDSRERTANMSKSGKERTIAGEEVRRELERKGLQLADTSVSGMETQELGVLIGGDHYWKIVTGKLEPPRWWRWTASLDG